MDPSTRGKQYNALVPHDKFEVWRSGGLKDLSFNQKDLDKSNQKIGEGENNYDASKIENGLQLLKTEEKQ